MHLCSPISLPSPPSPSLTSLVPNSRQLFLAGMYPEGPSTSTRGSTWWRQARRSEGLVGCKHGDRWRSGQSAWGKGLSLALLQSSSSRSHLQTCAHLHGLEELRENHATDRKQKVVENVWIGGSHGLGHGWSICPLCVREQQRPSFWVHVAPHQGFTGGTQSLGCMSAPPCPLARVPLCRAPAAHQ